MKMDRLIAEQLTQDINLINNESRNLTPTQIEKLVRAAFRTAEHKTKKVAKTTCAGNRHSIE